MNLSAMAPNHHHFMLNGPPMEPVSRTYQYRKIMKPMLERKRRARINKCLDELKDLMTGTLQADGENVSKLEKADILELTVRHLHRLREHNSLFLQANMLGGNGSNSGVLNTEKFWAGFQHCAAEVLQFLGRYDRAISGELIQHIAGYLPGLPLAATPPAPPNLPPPPPPPPPPPTATAALPTTAAAAGAPPTTRRPHLLARPESARATARATARARPRPYPRPREDEEPVWRPW